MTDRVYMQWRDVQLHVPVKKRPFSETLKQNKFVQPLLHSQKDDSLDAQQEDQGLPKIELKPLEGSRRIYKQILTHQDGYLMPGELVAIMGPSGCGKTSLLNVLSQRIMHICPGAKLHGKIDLNANPYKPGLYAHVGAYV